MSTPGERYAEQVEAWHVEREREAAMPWTRKAVDGFEDAKAAHPVARWSLFVLLLAGLCGGIVWSLAHC